MKIVRYILAITLAISLVSCSADNSYENLPPVTAPTEDYVPAADKLTVSVSSSVYDNILALLMLYETLEGVEVTVEEITESNLAAAKGSLIIADNIYNVNEISRGNGIVPISELASPLLAALADSVPDYLYSGEKVAFLPVGIDGYAYLCNTTLLGEILGEPDKNALADNLRKASVSQWETAVEQLFALITGSTEEDILRLSSAEYTLSGELPESIENLVAPYAINLSSPSAITKPLSTALNAIQLQPDANEMVLQSYVEFIEAETSMTATATGLLEPGAPLEELTIETAAALYEQDKVLFFRTDLSTAFRYLSEQTLAETVIFPLKLPIEGMEDSTHSYMLSSAITVTTPFVFAVSNTEDAAQYEAAMDFLVWFYYSETGKSYITDTLGLLEINHSTAKNPLSVQLADYIENDNVMKDMLLFTPPEDIARAEQLIRENYLTLEEWSADTVTTLTTELNEIF